MRVIEQVEEFCPDLRGNTLRDSGVLEEREVHVVQALSAQDVAAAVAERAFAGLGEGEPVELAGRILGVPALRISYQVRTREEAAARSGHVPCVDAEREAGLHLVDRVDLPAA